MGESAEADLREVTPEELGIRNGGAESVTLVDAQKLGGSAQRAYNLVANNGMEPVAVRGALRIGNGYANAYVENGKVYFRVDAVDAAGNAISPEALAKHELFHNYVSEEVIQAADDVIRESMSAEEFDAMKAAYREAYAKIYDLESMSEAEIERLLTEEIAADAYAGLNWFSEGTPVQEAVRAEANRNAPAQRAEAQQRKTGPPEGRGAIVTLPDGKKYVQADRQVIFGNDPDGWADQIEGYINRKIRSGEDVILTTDSGDVLKITKDTAGKASFRNYVTDESGRRRLMNDSEYEAKLNAEAHIDELAKVSERVNKNARPDEVSTDGRPIHGKFAENGWMYRETWFQDFDGQHYKVTLSIADGDKGVVVYNVGKMEKRTSPARKHGPSGSVAETGAQQGKSSSTANIRQTEGNSQEKSSGRASVDVKNRAANNENANLNNENAQETDAEWEQRRERWEKWREEDRKEAERLRRRDGTLAQANRENGSPAPDKGAGQVYRELMADGRSEIAAPISMDNPKTTVYKLRLESDGLGGYHTATVEYGGHRIYSDVGALKEVVARNAAEYADAMANKNFSEENNKRAKRLEAEKTSDEDARIAELFGNTEELNTAEQTEKTGEAAAAEATIDATTQKVTTEAVKAEKNFREDFEKITGGAMRMFVNAGDTVRRIAKATGNKSLEGYYFNAGAYSQRAGNWIAKGGARTDINGYKIGESLTDVLAPMRRDAAKYRDFQLYLLHMHNVDRMMWFRFEEKRKNRAA